MVSHHTQDQKEAARGRNENTLRAKRNTDGEQFRASERRANSMEPRL